MKALVIGLLIAASSTTMAAAQSTDALCHHAGLTYSPGSMITMGQSLQQCAITDAGLSVWSPIVVEDDAITSANCVSGGREFGQGSVLNAGTADLLCSRGVWFVKKD